MYYGSRIFDFEPFFASIVDREAASKNRYTLDSEKRLFTLDLPGVDPATVSVEADLDSDRVSVNVGEKKYYVVFANLDPDKITASLKHGRLTITAPKLIKEAKKTVKIEIG